MKSPYSESAAARGPTRRAVVKIAAVGLAGGAFGAGAIAVLARLSRTAPSPYAFFTESEAELLTAICEQLIPRDDALGATDAGVIHFIDRQLSGKLARNQQTYCRGLAAFRQTCLAEFKLPFEKLATEQKIEALRPCGPKIGMAGRSCQKWSGGAVDGDDCSNADVSVARNSCWLVEPSAASCDRLRGTYQLLS